MNYLSALASAPDPQRKQFLHSTFRDNCEDFFSKSAAKHSEKIYKVWSTVKQNIPNDKALLKHINTTLEDTNPSRTVPLEWVEMEIIKDFKKQY